MRTYREPENLYDQLEAILSTMQLGDISSDHRAELEGFRGWNYVAISAVAKQATRSLIYVYDDSDPSQREFRKSMRLTHGAQWRKAVVREHQGKVLDSHHPLVRILSRPNPYQSGGSFRWEQVQQLRLHGSCIILNRPNISRTRTVERYVVPMALVTPIKPSAFRRMPRGGITIHPGSSSAYVDRFSGSDWSSGIQQFFGVEIPAEMLTIIKYPHPHLRGDGASPTGAASHWIDTGSMIDSSRSKFYAEGPNGKMLIAAEIDTPSKVEELEDRLSRRLGEDGPRVTVIGNGATIATKKSADEMAYDVGHEQMRDAVLAAHGVSKAMVGNQDGMTYSSLAASLLGATMLSIQPDMDLIADEETVSIGSEYGPNISIEYEVPAINDPELEERRLAQDAQLGVLTVGEYRQKRGEKPFGNVYDHWILTSRGPVDPATLLQSSLALRVGDGAQETSLGTMPQQQGLLGSREQTGTPSQYGRLLPSPESIAEVSPSSTRALIPSSKKSHSSQKNAHSILIDETLYESLAPETISAFVQSGYELAPLFEQVSESSSGDLSVGFRGGLSRGKTPSVIVWDWSLGLETKLVLERLPKSKAKQRLLRALGKATKSKDRSYWVELCVPESFAKKLSLELHQIPGISQDYSKRPEGYSIPIFHGVGSKSLARIVRAVGFIEAPVITFRSLVGMTQAKAQGVQIAVTIDSAEVDQASRKLARILPHRSLAGAHDLVAVPLGIGRASNDPLAWQGRPLSVTAKGCFLSKALIRFPGEPLVYVPLRPPSPAPSAASIPNPKDRSVEA